MLLQSPFETFGFLQVWTWGMWKHVLAGPNRRESHSPVCPLWPAGTSASPVVCATRSHEYLGTCKADDTCLLDGLHTFSNAFLMVSTGHSWDSESSRGRSSRRCHAGLPGVHATDIPAETKYSVIFTLRVRERGGGRRGWEYTFVLWLSIQPVCAPQSIMVDSSLVPRPLPVFISKAAR